MNNFEALHIKLHSLVIFRNLLKRRTILALDALLCCDMTDTAAAVDAYSTFVDLLFCHGGDFSAYLMNFMLTDENMYTLQACSGTYMDDSFSTTLAYEVNFLQALSMFSAMDTQKEIRYNGFLPAWKNSKQDFGAVYAQRIADLPQRGVGVFSQYHSFTVRDGSLVPQTQSTELRFADLTGYEPARELLFQNTHALLLGKTAENVWLFGDDIAEKEATITALTNEFSQYGLRLIRIPANQLSALSSIAELLVNNPLKFIFYIEDVDCAKDKYALFSACSAVAGSQSLRLKNKLIYATVNSGWNSTDEQHLVQAANTIQNLQQQFLYSVNFSFSEQEKYHALVKYLAETHSILMNSEQLKALADTYALQQGGYNIHTAKGFIIQLLSNKDHQQ